MKQIFLFFALLLSVSLFASSFEHVQKDCSDLKVSQKAITSLLSDWYHLDEHVSFVESRVVTDQLGMTHRTLQQYVDGVPVKGGMILVHSSSNGLVKSINGDLLRVDDSCLSQQETYGRRALRTRFSAPLDRQYPIVWVACMQDGHLVTRKAYKVDVAGEYKIVYVDVTTGEVLKEESLVSSLSGIAYTYYSDWQNIEYSIRNGYNVLFDSIRNIETVNASRLALNEEGNLDYSTLYYFTNPDSIWDLQYLESVTLSTAAEDWWYNSSTDTLGDFYIKIKSSSGEVLYTSDYTADQNPPITFTIPDTVSIRINGGIEIEFWNHNSSTEGEADDNGGSVTIPHQNVETHTWSNSYTTGSYEIDELPHPAYDVHWGMERVWDYYLATFNHRGFDGNNGAVLQLVNPPSSIPIFSNAGYPYNASAFGGTGLFAYGYGGPERDWSYVVAIDVMGHEFTHAVTGANGNQNLPIYGEGGALNESFGDIMGNAVEKFAKGACDWLVGAEVTNDGLGLRSMMNPANPIYEDPQTYLTSPYWNVVTGSPTPDNDMDGVHSNCGVQNYWFYLLCQGGSGTNDNGETYNITGIGMDKAIQIVYRNLIYYITSESEYPQSRAGSIHAAQDLLDNNLFGFTATDVQTVKDAWDAVGVYSSSIITGVDEVLNLNTATKCIIDGHLFILRDGHKFTITGAIIE